MANKIIKIDSPTTELVKFLKNRHILTLATCNQNFPYCANCFYVYHKQDQVFIFTSDKNTRHIEEGTTNNQIAGTIYLDTKVIGKIRGIQFTGKLYKARDKLLKRYKLAFIKKFPYTAVNLSDIWFIKPDYIKLTDNRLGYGTKLIWEINQ